MHLILTNSIVDEFAEDLGGAIVLMDAPNIMDLAGHLRDLPYKKANSKGRMLATPDAILLATSLYLRDVLGVEMEHFHTYDKGKRRGPDGKSIPLLTSDQWCEGIAETNLLPRYQPVSKGTVHPEPRWTLRPR